MAEVVKKQSLEVELTTYKEQIFAEIETLANEYKGLTIAGIDDKEGYAVVQKARMTVVKKRTAVEAKRKELKAESLEIGRNIDSVAKEITAAIEAIEKPLTDMQAKIDAEKQAIIDAERKAEEARLQGRRDRLYAFKMAFNGQHYSHGEKSISELDIKLFTDEQFDAFCLEVATIIDAELKAEQEAAAERERIAKEQAELSAKLEAQRKEQEAKQAAIDAENARIEREKAIKEAAEAAAAKARSNAEAAAESERLRLIKEKEAAEKSAAAAIQKAKDDAERAAKEAEAKRLAEIEKERKAKEAAERKARNADDKTKLLTLADRLEAVINDANVPKFEDGIAIFNNARAAVIELAKFIRTNSQTL